MAQIRASEPWQWATRTELAIKDWWAKASRALRE